jgi:hypothetical protein
MSTDRITEIHVRFEDASGREVLVRRYRVDPDTAYIKANNPQGRNPGYVEVKGSVIAFADTDGKEQS